MDLAQAMRTAAAVRRFRPDPVPDDALYRVLDSARFAPSWGNRQGWRVIVVRDQATRTQLRRLYQRTWQPLYEAQLAQGHSASNAPGRPSHGAMERNYYAEHLDELPVHLVVTVERAALLTPLPALNQSTFASGSLVFPFLQNPVVAIPGKGLGPSPLTTFKCGGT